MNPTMSQTAPLLARLDGVRPAGSGWMARCPAHADRRPSLRIDERDGRLLVHCFAGCAAADVLAAVGLSWHSLRPGLAAPPRRLRPGVELRRPEGAAELWLRAEPVHGTAAATWLKSRGIDPAAVEDRNLARVLPPGNLPSWAWYRGRSWRSSGHELVVPMYDHMGRVATVHARSVGAAEPKGLTPAGCSIKGAVMADSLGRLILAGEAGGWPEVRVVVTEGVPDFLAAATQATDSDVLAPALLGIIAGCWSVDLALRVPRHAEVVLATDTDDAGERYAALVAGTLPGRRLRRWSPR